MEVVTIPLHPIIPLWYMFMLPAITDKLITIRCKMNVLLDMLKQTDDALIGNRNTID